MAMYRRLIYRSYRRIFGIRYWLGRRFTRAGKFALACLIVSAGLGVDTNQTTAYQAYAFLIVAFVVAYLWIAFQRRRSPLSVRRLLPRFGTAGIPLTYRAVVMNGTARMQRGMTLMEDLEDPRPSLEEFSARPRHPARDFFGRLDELVGLARWWQLVAIKQTAVIDEQPIPDVPPRGTVELRVEFTPRRRGRVHFTGATLARSDVFGLVRSLRRLTVLQSLLVLPKRYILPRLALPGTREYQPAGVALASAVGESDEFVALRDYRPGDPLRQIHWRSVAKMDRLIVRENEDEFFVRHALILDTFATPEQAEAFEEAVSVAASFVSTIQTQESLLDLLFVGTEAYCFTAGRGVGNVERMLEVLAGVGVCADKPFPSLETLVLRHAALVSGCVCVFLAWDKPRQRLVERLKSLRVPLLVCVVTDDTQFEPTDFGPMKGSPKDFHHLRIGKIQEALARL
jgi:uncharacterized protein (DUF58 family)